MTNSQELPGPHPDLQILTGLHLITGDVVLDQLTGLIWTRDANLLGTKITWLDALTYAATGLSVGG